MISNHRKYTAAFVGITVLASIAFVINSDIQNLNPNTSYPDAINYYLPYGRLFADMGISFFQDVRSSYVFPLSYIYPSFFQSDVLSIKTANIVLHIISLLLVFRLGCNLLNPWSGAASTVLFSASPLLRAYFPTVLTEPVYITLMLLWAWAISELIARNHRWAIIPAGVAFGLAVLTRGVNTYYLYLLCLALPVLFFTSKGSTRGLYRDLTIAHYLALVFPISLILCNGIQFGLWGASGAGAVLYYSLHPLFRGLDPQYYNLPWDHNIVLNGIEHASIEADAIYKGIAFEMLRDWSIPDLIDSFVTKTKYFLFFSPVEAASSADKYEYGFRAALLTFAIAGLIRFKQRILAWILGGMVIYQIVIHAVLVYTYRYTILFETLLIPFAGTALAAITVKYSNMEYRSVVYFALIVVAATGAYLNQAVRSHTVVQVPATFPHKRLMMLTGSVMGKIRFSGMKHVKDDVFEITESRSAVMLPGTPIQPDPERPAIASIRLAVYFLKMVVTAPMEYFHMSLYLPAATRARDT